VVYSWDFHWLLPCGAVVWGDWEKALDVPPFRNLY
jgi:hypothetical protein